MLNTSIGQQGIYGLNSCLDVWFVADDVEKGFDSPLVEVDVTGVGAPRKRGIVDRFTNHDACIPADFGALVSQRIVDDCANLTCHVFFTR